ncbi:hypothetical protein [Methanobrevibacter smithii]|uniref:hypothetical protein n=1 Tax=Methanobrevibacter smithii TaxID=2173 RepID=UPI0037DDB1FE
MAKYTITIKTLIDNNFDFQMTNYPIFDENYRETLNNNILHHYYENEIGFETAPLFRFYLNQKLNEIMPYYNELYKVQKKLIDENLLLNNVNLTEQLSSKNTTQTSSTSKSTNNGTSDNRNLFQDTPQGEISNTDIDNQKWATNLTLDRNTTNNTINDTSSATGNGTNSYLKTIIGNNGGKFNVDILNDIKNNLMNIDLMIINELYDLFMQIF